MMDNILYHIIMPLHDRRLPKLTNENLNIRES